MYALPRGSLLAYFRPASYSSRRSSSRRRKRTSRNFQRSTLPPPPYALHETTTRTTADAGRGELGCVPEGDLEVADGDGTALGMLPRGKSGGGYACSDTDTDDDDDEEEEGEVHAQMHGKNPSSSCSGGGGGGVSEALCFVWILLTVLVWAWSMAILVRWAGRGKGGGDVMPFCLETPDDRNAPYPRVWRYMVSSSSSSSTRNCTSQIVKLAAADGEGWRLYPDDEVLFGGGEDDLAVEGVHR